jgi:flagellar hook-associated protein 3 FlgL
MRITQGMITEAFMRNLSNNLKRLGEKQDILSSGKRVSRPSDDPVSAATAMRIRENMASLEQYIRNTDDAITWLNNTESALSNVNDILQRIRELTVKAANGTNTPDDRIKILDEVTQLKEQLLQEANTSYSGRYIFAGYFSDRAPFYKDIDGTIKPIQNFSVPISAVIITSGAGLASETQIDIKNLGTGIETGRYKINVANYDGTAKTADVTVIKVEDDGTEVTVAGPATISTDQDDQAVGGFVFDLKANPITGDGTAEISLTSGRTDYNVGRQNRISVDVSGREVFSDIFSAVEALEKDLLENNQAGLSGDRIADIDKAISEVLKFRSLVGARINRVEATKSRLESNRIDYTDLLSKTEDADIAQVIMDLKMEENVYRASLAVGARIIQPNLADFLR